MPLSEDIGTPAAQSEEGLGPVSEDAIARAFTREYGATMRHDFDAGKWFRWSGTRWEPLRTPAVFHYVRLISRRMGEGCRKICKASVASGAERFARADPVHAVSQHAVDLLHRSHAFFFRSAAFG